MINWSNVRNMLVEQLIEELKTFNPKAEISRDDSETILLSYISEGGVDKTNTKLVFVEKCDYVDDRFSSES